MIVWETAAPSATYERTRDGRTLERRYRLEHRSIRSLHMRETPSLRRVKSIDGHVRAGGKIPAPLVDRDGFVLDGHHRLATAARSLGVDAVIPVIVHEAIDATRQAAFLQVLDEHLRQACENVKAGFYFEEGGCFGMALALHATLTAHDIDAALAATSDFVHAYVVAHGELYDWSGRLLSERPSNLKTMKPNDFLHFAAQHGHHDEDLFPAQQLAQSAIGVALDLNATATPRSSSRTLSPG